MNKIKTVKIKNEDGSISEESYTIAADAINIDMNNGKNLQETVGNIEVNTDGNIASQLNNRIKKNEIIDNLDSVDSTKVLSAKQGNFLNNKIKKKIYFFNTIADMKLANLQVGDYVHTLGYYEADDGGGAEYQIIDDESSTDDGGSIHDLSNGLKAKLIIKNDILNFDSIGAKALDNSFFNNAILLQKAINICENNAISIIEFNNKEYYFSSGFAINNNNLKITLQGKENTIFTLRASDSQGLEFHVLHINAINTFEMKNITVHMHDTENLNWSQRLSWFASKSSSNNAQQIVISNCCFEYMNYGFKIDQKNIITTPVLSQGYTQNVIIENTIFKKCRRCLHICNAHTITIKNCICSGLTAAEHAETGSTNNSIIFYIRPNIENLFLDNLTISDCTGDVLHFNQFAYGESEPEPEDYLDYFVNNVFINNIKMENIGRFIGLNSYTKNITANNIHLNSMAGPTSNAVVYAWEGKFEKVFINNFSFKDIYSLINLTENARTGDTISFTNGVVEHSNRRYVASVGSLKKLVLDNIYFKRLYQSSSNTAAQCLALNGKYDIVSLTNLTCDLDHEHITAACDLFRFASNFKGSVFADNINIKDMEDFQKQYNMVLFYFNNAILDTDIFGIFNNINAIKAKIFSDASTFPTYNNVHINNCYVDKILYSR